MLQPSGRTARPGAHPAALAVLPPLPTSAEAVPDVGEAAGLEAVEQLMMELVRTETGSLGRIAAEHLGAGGKRLRARLSLAALAALGGREEDGIGWAAACELLHNATLIHDDLQDGDRVRRGSPTVWARHGAAQAINAGDLLLMLPFLALERTSASAETRWRLARLLAGSAARVARGQAAEIGLAPGMPVDWTGYRAMVAGKTGALFQLPVEGAALLAGLTPAAAHAVALEFQRLGVLFQLQDDVLDLYGDKGRERVGSDLRAGRTTLLVVEHLARAPADRDWLLALLAAPREATREAEVRTAIARFRASGALAAVLARIAGEADAVAGSPALAAVPGLREIATELTRVVLEPIAHLIPQRGGTGPGAVTSPRLRAAGGAG